MYSLVCSWWYVWQFNDGRIEVVRYVCVCGREGAGQTGEKIGAGGHEGK